MEDEILLQIKKGQISLRRLFQRLIDENNIADSKWAENYFQLTKALSSQIPLDDQFIQTLWYAQENGVSSMRLGRLSWDEFTQLKPELRMLTESIRQMPDVDHYERVHKRFRLWKLDKRIRIMHWATINRVFAAMDPQNCTTIINEDLFNRVAHFLNNHFSLGLKLNGNWLINNHELKAILNEKLSEINPLQINMALWHLYTLIAENDTPKVGQVDIVVKTETTNTPGNASVIKMDPPRNVIYYGPPGTGKTFFLQQEMKKYTAESVVSDATWIDDQLSELTWMGVIALVLIDLSYKATVQEIVEHNWYQRKSLLNGRGDESGLKNTAWHFLQKYSVADSKTLKIKERSEPGIFDKLEKIQGKRVEWILVQSQLSEIDEIVIIYNKIKSNSQHKEPVRRYATVTFHQSYGYEEFIEGICVETDEDKKTNYFTKPGAFKALCMRASLDPQHRYAIFIDEINRGNISKIFGELISLIEVDKRAGMKNELSVQLAYSPKPFSVPANVDIIGAMNTADRSLALMDTALRRRFDFIEMMPDMGRFSGLTVKNIELEPLLETLNLRIEALYDREHTLGHAFFFPVKEAADQELAFSELKRVFQKKIIPLLQEYFFDDWAKIRLVLADNQKPQHLQFIEENDFNPAALFGEEYADSLHSCDIKRYQLKNSDEEVWNNPLAWRGIYQTVNDEQDNEA